MAGISISVLGLNEGWLRWLEAPTTAPSWPNVLKLRPRTTFAPITTNVVTPVKSAAAGSTRSKTSAKLRRAIKAACQALIEAEPELTEMDRITGDADLGASMKRAATAIQENLESYPLDDIPATVKALGHTLRQELGGSSGPLYGVLFLRRGNVLQQKGATGLAQWTEAVEAGSHAISELGGAKPGDRTMLDALDPFVRSLKSSGANASRNVLLTAVEAAERGAEATATTRPHLGRSSYLGDRAIGHPDPGAMAVAIWLRAICQARSSQAEVTIRQAPPGVKVSH